MLPNNAASLSVELASFVDHQFVLCGCSCHTTTSSEVVSRVFLAEVSEIV